MNLRKKMIHLTLISLNFIKIQDVYHFFVLLALPCFALSLDEYLIVLKNHQFYPKILKVPAEQKFKLIIDNQDIEAEEFESFDLRREKIIPAQSSIKINLGPLEPGSYSFVGEFHSETAKGTLIVESNK